MEIVASARFPLLFYLKKKRKRKKRDSNPGGFGNAELGLCQPNVSRDVKVHRGGRSGEVAPLLPSRNTEAAAVAASAAHAAATAETRASIGKHSPSFTTSFSNQAIKDNYDWMLILSKTLSFFMQS